MRQRSYAANATVAADLFHKGSFATIHAMTDQEQLAGYDHGIDRTPELRPSRDLAERPSRVSPELRTLVAIRGRGDRRRDPNIAQDVLIP